MGSILFLVVSAVLVDPTALPQTDAKQILSARRRFDRRILLLFAVLAVSSISVPFIIYLLAEGVTTHGLASSALGSLTLSFLVVGVPAYLRYGRNNLALRSRIFRFAVILSVTMAVVAVAAIGLASMYAPDVVEFEKLSAVELVLTGALISVAMFIAFLVMCYAGLVSVFGVVGVLAATERLVTPWILLQVVRSDGTGEPSLVGRLVKWMFAIPDVIDTRTLTLHPTDPRKRVFLSDLKAMVLWQLIFGFVLGIYISLNPFVSDRSPEALLTMFSVLATASILFPFLILPWFLFLKLGASIAGQKRQFTLYDGIRSRVFRSYFAIGTIVILIRLSIQDIAVAFETYVAAFAAFMGSVLVSSLLATCVYLAYFENDLVGDVVDGLRGSEIQVAS